MEILLQHEREKLAVMIKDVSESQINSKEIKKDQVRFYRIRKRSYFDRI